MTDPDPSRAEARPPHFCWCDRLKAAGAAGGKCPPCLSREHAELRAALLIAQQEIARKDQDLQHVLDTCVPLPELEEAQADVAVLTTQLAQLREWHPIETAPKDGTKIDIWAKHWRAWDDSFDTQRFANCYWLIDDCIGNRRARWNGLDSGWRPTHWLPLPDPPEVTHSADQRTE